MFSLADFEAAPNRFIEELAVVKEGIAKYEKKKSEREARQTRKQGRNPRFGKR